MRPLLKIVRLNLLRYAAAVRTLKHFSDWASKRTFLMRVIRHCSYREANPPTKLEAPLIALRLAPLEGAVIHCRSGLADFGVIYDTFEGAYHLPPPDLLPIESILDLGSNIGLTMVHYAALFPNAKILGAELDAGNYWVAKKNIEQFGERCRIVHAAVWHEPGEVPYGGVRESGYAVIIKEGEKVKDKVRAVTVDALIDKLGVPMVDFVKMDIEGAEREVIRNAGSWIGRVRCLKVEVHPDKASQWYSVDDCYSDLTRLGMRCTFDPAHPACVIARRA